MTHLEKHYKLMESGKWRVDRSNLDKVVYYLAGLDNPAKMSLDEAYKLEFA